jgi:hypothetical protein
MTQMPPPRSNSSNNPNSTNSWIGKSGDLVRMPAMSTRRGKHGGTAWSMPFTEQGLMQPQDGAVDPRARLASMRSHQHSDLLHEAEDARLTGGTRSLDRRLLGLNVLDTQVKRSAAKVNVEALTQIDVA